MKQTGIVDSSPTLNLILEYNNFLTPHKDRIVVICLKGWPKLTHSLVMDDIIRQLAQFTISNLNSPPYVGATIEEVAEALNQLSVSTIMGARD